MSSILPTVNNVAPSISSLATGSINENDVASVSGTFTDPGTLDVYPVELVWGDGTVETFTLAVGARDFSLTHQYLDDDPTGAASDVYTIGVTVTDDDTGVATASTTVTVNNVAPVLTALVNPSPLESIGAEGETVALELRFEDPGAIDEHTVVVDWGDGNVETVALSVSDRAAAIDHIYEFGGVYTIGATLSDDDTGVDNSSDWEDLSIVTITGTEMVIDLTNAANQYDIAADKPTRQPDSRGLLTAAARNGRSDLYLIAPN